MFVLALLSLGLAADAPDEAPAGGNQSALVHVAGLGLPGDGALSPQIIPDAQIDARVAVPALGVDAALGLDTGPGSAASSRVEAGPSGGASSRVPAMVQEPVAWGSAAALGGVAAIGVVPALRRAVARVLRMGVLFVLFSRVADGALTQQPMRRRIKEYVEAHPGATIKDVCDVLEIAWGTAVYHLGRLERGGHLVSARDGRLRRHYVRGSVAAALRHQMQLLRHATPRRLAQAALAHPGLMQRDLGARAGVSPPVASKFLGRLVAAGLLAVEPVGRTRQYHPTEILATLPHWDGDRLVSTRAPTTT
jgi:DNA-binding MarR family transcriptional regulator